MTPNEPNPTDGIPRKHVSRVELQKKLTQACRDANLAMGPRFVAQIVFTFADARVGEAWPSISLVAHEAGCDEDTARSHVRALQRAGILWTILPPRRASKSGVAPDPLRALVAFAPGADGRPRPVKTGGEHPTVPPDGRALFLVRPCASQLAAVRWQTDPRVIRQWTTDAALAARAGKRLEVSEQPAATVPPVDATARPANEPPAPRAPVVEPPPTVAAPVVEQPVGGKPSRYDMLRAALAHTDDIDLSGPPALREQCAAYLDERGLSEEFIGILSDPQNVAFWFRAAHWPKEKPRADAPRVASLLCITLAKLAGNYDIRNGERVYTWEPLGRIIDGVREDLAAQKREAEERRRQNERTAEYLRKQNEAKERRAKVAAETRERLRGKYPDLDLDTQQGLSAAEMREFKEANATLRATNAETLANANRFREVLARGGISTDSSRAPVLPSEAPRRADGRPHGAPPRFVVLEDEATRDALDTLLEDSSPIAKAQ